MGILSTVSNFAGSIFGSGAVKEGAAAGREEAMRYSEAARADLAPFKQFGLDYGVTGLKDLMAKPDSITETPFYKFKLSEGLGALEKSKLAKGKFFSGETARDIIDYAEGLVSTSYADEFARRFSLANLGQSSAAGQANIYSNLANLMSGSLQTQGQDVASLNAYGMKQIIQGASTWASGGFGGGKLFE